MSRVTVSRETVAVEVKVYRWQDGDVHYRLELQGYNYRLFEGAELYASGRFAAFDATEEIDGRLCDTELLLDNHGDFFVGLRLNSTTEEMDFVNPDEVEDYLGDC